MLPENPFLTIPEKRLKAWKNTRQAVTECADNIQKIQSVLDFWKQAPLENRILDWDNSNSWPSPWELLTNNHYCESTHSLGIAYTLLLASPELFSNLSLDLINDRNNSIQKIVVNWDGYYLNHGYMDIKAKHELTNIQTQNRWTWDGKKWIAVLRKQDRKTCSEPPLTY
jgi:hypothetical protein